MSVARLCAGARRLWPKTLFAQLLLIMVSGTLTIQLLSSSIWFDVRFAQVLEAPVRLIASRTAVVVGQAGCSNAKPVAAPARYRIACLDAAPEADNTEKRGRRRIELLLRQALAYELGHDQAVRVLSVQLTDEHGQTVVWRSLFGLRTAIAHVRFAVPLADGRWLDIEGQELQGWSGESAWALIADYVLRIYVLRILAVLAICWLAVRICLRPLQRLSDAARGLGDNLEQAPLVVEGPQEVRQAAQTFNGMQQRLIAMVNDQSFFLAAVSHDLRTPLTRMRLRIERLTEDTHRERLKQNIVQMDRMIGQVLDYLQSARQQSLQAVDIDKLLSRLCADLKTLDEPLPILGRGGLLYANEVLLHRCLQNLLVNALRYARQIVISLARNDEGLIIRIKDRGPGIPEAMLASITEPFIRGESSRNPQSGGYGLGLSIAKRIAMSHEGHLTLRNRAEGGLVVELLFPHREG
jgi:signal transduction histidine kinase